MEFTLKINLDPRAVESGDGHELAAILLAIANNILEGDKQGKEDDGQGNIIAEWAIK